MQTDVNAAQKTDEALMLELSRGHESALAELVRRYQNDIYRFCLHYLKDVEVAREMTQEAFIRVYSARERFDVNRKFRPWVLCIARNLCMNELKRKKTVSMETLEEYASASRDDTGEVFRYSGHGPDEVLMASERQEFLKRALAEMPEDARELIVLRYFERMQAKEIAEILNSSEGAVRTRLHRLLLNLRERYLAQRDEV